MGPRRAWRGRGRRDRATAGGDGGASASRRRTPGISRSRPGASWAPAAGAGPADVVGSVSRTPAIPTLGALVPGCRSSTRRCAADRHSSRRDRRSCPQFQAGAPILSGPCRRHGAGQVFQVRPGQRSRPPSHRAGARADRGARRGAPRPARGPLPMGGAADASRGLAWRVGGCCAGIAARAAARTRPGRRQSHRVPGRLRPRDGPDPDSGPDSGRRTAFAESDAVVRDLAPDADVLGWVRALRRERHDCRRCAPCRRDVGGERRRARPARRAAAFTSGQAARWPMPRRRRSPRERAARAILANRRWAGRPNPLHRLSQSAPSALPSSGRADIARSGAVATMMRSNGSRRTGSSRPARSTIAPGAGITSHAPDHGGASRSRKPDFTPWDHSPGIASAAIPGVDPSRPRSPDRRSPVRDDRPSQGIRASEACEERPTGCYDLTF